MTAGRHRATRHRVAPANPGAHDARRRTSTVAALGVAACTTIGLIGVSPADAAARPDHGSLSYAWQDSSTRELHIRGYAYDKGSSRSTDVTVFVDGRSVHTSAANHDSPTFDRRHHLRGRHGFRSVFRVPAGVHTVSLMSGTTQLTAKRVTHYRNAGAYIVAVARRHVGASYRYGADGPRAFDCSGYAKYVYGRTDLATLPHNSESQRHAKHMRTVSRRSARPGDLVFYLSGGDAYHVAIYAGNGRQYSATNPARGVEYSEISSRNVVFGSDWH